MWTKQKKKRKDKEQGKNQVLGGFTFMKNIQVPSPQKPNNCIFWTWNLYAIYIYIYWVWFYKRIIPILIPVLEISLVSDSVLTNPDWNQQLIEITYLGVIWIVSSRNMFIFSIDNREVIFNLFFAFNFSDNMLVILQHALISTLKKKIALVSYACSRPSIIIRFHDLHVHDIRGHVGEITSYHERETSSFSFWALWAVCLLTFLWCSFFCLPWDGFDHWSFIGFLFQINC